MNLFIREMKANSRALIIWSVGMVLMIYASMVKFEGISGTGQANELMRSLPKSLQAMMGVGAFDISKMSGYYGVMFLFLQLAAGIHAAMLGSGILSKEERDKTSEFLFSKPLSRKAVLTAKLAAAFLNILIFNLVTLFSSLIFVPYYAKGENLTDGILKLMLCMFILQVIFLTAGSAIAATVGKPRTAVSVSTGVMLAAFILTEVINISGRLDALRYFTPFSYFDTKKLIYSGGFDPVFVILSAVLVALFFALTYSCFCRKDLNI